MNGVFLLTWFLASAGFAKLLAMGENALHGYGWPRSRLQRVRAVHNVCLFGYPLFLLSWPGLSGPELVWGNDWSRLSLPAWLFLGAGLIGFGLLVASSVRHLTYRPPACEIDCRTRLVDMRAETAAETLIGPGRAKWLARLPYNEQFSLEVHEKTYVLPRLPAEWDGLSIVHFSDVHFRGPVRREYFERVMAEAQQLGGDLVAFTGDLLDSKSCLEWVPETLGRLKAPLGCYFVLGNHDWYVGIERQIRETLGDCGWVDVSGQTMELRRDGARLILCGNERPWMGTLPDLSTADPELFRILLSHGPDQIDWARRQGIDLMLAGHTHGGQIRLPVLGPVYSPSVYSCRYAGGVFWEPPTLMSVSRGVSGREPLRYNCRPEITRLVLKCREMERSPVPVNGFRAAAEGARTGVEI